MFKMYHLAKAHKLPFTSKHVASITPFDFLYMDLWTSPVVATIGAHYFLSIVEDYSMYMWIFFLNTKDEICIVFQCLMVMIERNFDQKIKSVQTNKGVNLIFFLPN